MKNFVAIDFETANHYRCSICSVGVVIVRDGVVSERIYHLVRPEPEYYNYTNSRIHGITAKDTESALLFPDVWALIAPKIEGLPLVAHNSAFDSSCLRSVFKIYQLDYPNYQFYCTLKASRKIFKNLTNHKLNTVAMHCGFELQNHHHALADAEACAAIALQTLILS